MSSENYKVQWVGIREGYSISETSDDVDDYEVFATYREAKSSAVQKAQDDVYGAKQGLQMTRSIRKGDV